MNALTDLPALASPFSDRLPPPVRDEAQQVARLLSELHGRLDWAAVIALGTPWVDAVRQHPAPFWAMESLLREYPISSAEGLALMRLAEALLRVPDTETALALTADQLGRADFAAHTHDGQDHALMSHLAAQAIELSKKMLPEHGDAATGPRAGLLQRLGAKTVVAATVRAIQLLGRQFVLGQHIGEALDRADANHRAHRLLRHSFDMLGEGARTDADAQRYARSYADAIRAIAARGRASRPEDGDGISIKLSAIDPRYEAAQFATVQRRMMPRLLALVDAAASANLNLTIDAEETERLELSLAVLDATAAHVAQRFPTWRGLGLAVQAYQTRAPEMVEAVIEIARRHGLRLMVRLVKGAYWDGEIKRAQEMGLSGYPVWTDKRHTDLSYLACAQRLLAAAEIYPQFATHNAGTIAAILEMARAAGRIGADPGFELQRLHGMGEGIHREVMKRADAPPLRIYAPVGEHRDLLAYLVRRLLENGANSSFVHQLADEAVSIPALLASPLRAAAPSTLPLPRRLYGESRVNALGVDPVVERERLPLLARLAMPMPSAPTDDSAASAALAMDALHRAQPGWNAVPLSERCAVLRRAADGMERQMTELVALLAQEGRKTFGDGVAEVREAIDFCRYYAEQAEARLAPQALPGPTGEKNELRLHGRGVFVCISPWNFPLAIFAGQVVAALVAGNTVAAKPAEQTPRSARRCVELLIEAGLPADAIRLVCGPGETVGAALVAHPRCAGVCFTGSTQVAKIIQRQLAMGDGPIVPLIAETGGLNAMIVDSSALPEQVVDAVVQSAFRSAGQRCSALRLLLVHEGVADKVTEMIAGAMAELICGDPADAASGWSVDVGPVIDAEAHAGLSAQVARLEREARLVARTAMDARFSATHIAPVAFELKSVQEMKQEIFGPVLHIVRWSGPVDAVVDQVNALGYGLTLGIHTRIDDRAHRIAERARVGNVYVNRNMIGAVVGVQPFGGEGLSGTGPKAGGPHYLYRFCGEQTLTVNTAAAGGNAALLAGSECSRP